MSTIEDNLNNVLGRIDNACVRSGRDKSSVTLVAVTKTVGEDEIRQLYDLGVRDFGENRVEVLLPKLRSLSDLRDINWHFIGHLQRNKAKKVLGEVYAIHSVESTGLLKIISESEYSPKVFLEVSISGEENKYGLIPADTEALVREYMDSVDIIGLMTMAPFYDDVEDTREVFAGLCKLGEDISEKLGIDLNEFSMGMSNDFEVAIEEGATFVRVGSELFK